MERLGISRKRKSIGSRLLAGVLLLLAIQGTARADALSYTSLSAENITIEYSSDLTQVQVLKDGVVVQTQSAATTTSIIYQGSSGADRFANKTDLPVVANGSYGNDIIIGGSGDDSLSGSSGMDLIVGGSGDDYLNGGSYPDILIGGSGADTMNARGGNDLLIAGPTVYDDRDADLDILSALWLDSNVTVDDLLNGIAGIHFSYEGHTVMDDGAADSLEGHTENDFMLCSSMDTITDTDGLYDVLNPWFKAVDGGSNLFGTNNWLDLIALSGSQSLVNTNTPITVTGMPFTNAYQVTTVLDSTPSPNDSRLALTSTETVDPDDLLMLNFFYRSDRVTPDPEAATIGISWSVTSPTTNYSFETKTGIVTSPEWTQYVSTVELPADADEYTVNVVFYYGSSSQSVAFGDLQLLAYDSGTYTAGEISQPDALNL